MYEFDEDILPRPKLGVTQKHRFSSDRKIATLQTNLPFYYPNKADHYRLPSFTIDRRLFTSKKISQCKIPYYSSYNDEALCSSCIKPRVTLKGC
jgi:hypothetical protein